MHSSREHVALGVRTRVRVIDAFADGWKRVLRAPGLTFGIFALTALFALPFALVIDETVEADFGNSVVADRVFEGWPADWAAEFNARTTGLGRTLTHEILGFGGTIAPAARLLDGVRPPTPLVWAIAAYVLAWVFLSGGAMDRLARGRSTGISGFFAASGVYFFRFVRLAVLIGAAYALIFWVVRPWLFGTVYNQLTRDATTEGAVLVWRAALYVALLLLLMAVSIVADFAKVRMVVEDRRSALATLGAAFRFIRRRPLRVLGLYLINILAVVVLGRLWLQSAPLATSPVWVALLLSQIYLVARLWAKLAFVASEIALFQGDLAHPEYTALAEPVWPESPAVEANRNL